jgi:hypothetical protein
MEDTKLSASWKGSVLLPDIENAAVLSSLIPRFVDASVDVFFSKPNADAAVWMQDAEEMVRLFGTFLEFDLPADDAARAKRELAALTKRKTEMVTEIRKLGPKPKPSSETGIHQRLADVTSFPSLPCLYLPVSHNSVSLLALYVF